MPSEKQKLRVIGGPLCGKFWKIKIFELNNLFWFSLHKLLQKLQYFYIFPADNLILRLEMGKSVKTWKVFAE